MELEEYQAFGGSAWLIEQLKPRVLALFDYLNRFKNTDGLLEKLEGWIYVDGAANKFTQDLNFPSNMVYAAALDAAARLYHLSELGRAAAEIRETIRRLSYDGQFFVDNAMRQDGRLVLTRNRTEACQYYAFYFDVATPETHPELWKRLLTEFGPARDVTRSWPEIPPSCAFIANAIRLALLSRYGVSAQVLQDAVGYLWHMVERTGTLWESQDEKSSCNHGFASHICQLLYRDALGIKCVDPIARRITLRFSDVPFQWCEGSYPVPGGRLALQWWRKTARFGTDTAFRPATRWR